MTTTAAEGAAFPPLVRALLTAVTASVFAAGFAARDHAALQGAGLEVKLLIACGLALLLVFNYWVFKSRTRVDAGRIHQTWIWDKQVKWSDVVHAKMIYVPYLSWLIAPRLVVRGRSGMVMLFHAADAEVLAAFAQYAMAPQMRER